MPFSHWLCPSFSLCNILSIFVCVTSRFFLSVPCQSICKISIYTWKSDEKEIHEYVCICECVCNQFFFCLSTFCVYILFSFERSTCARFLPLSPISLTVLSNQAKMCTHAFFLPLVSKSNTLAILWIAKRKLGSFHKNATDAVFLRSFFS